MKACKETVGVGSTIFAVKPGDGSAREQAASCQKVLGGWANIANSYATKRYRSNLINWGMLPFLIEEGDLPFAKGDYIFVPEIRKAIDKYGYYHATNEGGYISWYDFTCEIYRQAGYDTKVIPVTTEEYGMSKAARPFNSRLDKSKLVKNGFTPLPTWQDALSRYLKEIQG